VIFADADRSTGLKNPANRLFLLAVPPLQEVAVGQVLHARVRVESTLPVEVAMAFPGALFDLITGAPMVRVDAGTHILDWSLYAKATSGVDARLTFEARSESLYQTAELIVRVADASS